MGEDRVVVTKDDKLTDREKIILILKLGLGFEGGVERREQTYEEVGGALGLSRTRIRQLTFRAIKKIVASHMRNWELVRHESWHWAVEAKKAKEEKNRNVT